MKFNLRLITALMLALVLITVSGCGSNESPDDATSYLTAEQAAIAQYDNAVSEIGNAMDYALKVTAKKTSAVSDRAYSVSSDQIIYVKNFGTHALQVKMDETMTIGKLKTEISEVFSNDTCYFTVNGNSFTGTLTSQAFLDRYIPSVILTPSLYTWITAETNVNGTTIRMQAPTAAESWAMPEGAVLEDAVGFAYLDKDGSLIKSTYRIIYTYGTVGHSFEVTTEPQQIPDNLEITLPQDTECPPLEYAEAARMLEIANGYLLQTNKINVNATENISSQASGLHWTNAKSLAFTNSVTGLEATLDTTVTLLNQSLGTETSTHSQREEFSGGNYYLYQQPDTETPVHNPNITEAQMLAYCQDLLVGNILLPQYLTGATMADEGATYSLQFTASEDLAKLLIENACQILYKNSQMLTELATSYQTLKMEANLIIDKHSGLPVSAGIVYSGEHTIADFAYILDYQTHITFRDFITEAIPSAEATVDTTE